MQDKLKESKISRHQQAKEKFRLFERSHSSKSLNQKSQFIPIPGQFAIQTKKKKQQTTQLPKIKKTGQSIRFTTNLRLITKQKSPEMVSDLLHDVVNQKIQNKSLKKLHRSESTGNVRPITAQIYQGTSEDKNINQSRLILDAASYDKRTYFKQQFGKKNTFMVKSRSQIPKHGYGYNALKLQKEKKLKIQEAPQKFYKIQQQNSLQQATKFLPIEYYLIDDERPDQLIEKYKIMQNVMIGYSKWYDLNGEFGWKKCRIIGYQKDKQRWQIEWLHNGKRKFVSRNNLYFQNQNHDNFQKIVSNAEEHRKKSQTFMKYNLLIDLMKSPTNQLSQEKISRIMKLVLGKQFQNHSIKSYENLVNNPQKLMTQIMQKYIRANHQVQFNASLPYNQKHKQQFKQFLPPHLFKPNCQYKNQQKNQQNKKINFSSQTKNLFKQNCKKFKQKSSLISTFRIQIIQFLNTFQIEMNKKSFFKFYQSKFYKIQDIKQIFQKGLAEMLSKINCAVCDVQHWIGKQLDNIYANKKMIGQAQFNKTIQNYMSFLYLINYRMEVISRRMLTKMLCQFNQLFDYEQKIVDYQKDMKKVELTQQYEQIQESKKCKNQELFKTVRLLKKIPNLLKVKIKIQVKDNKINTFPKYNQIGTIFNEFVSRTFKEFAKITCISKSYIQQIRPKNKMNILNDLKSENPQKIHPQVQLLSQKLFASIKKSSQLFQSFFNQMQKIVTSIYGIQNQLKKKQQKKCSYSDLEEFISQIQQNQIFLTNLSLVNGKNVSVRLRQQQQCHQILSTICKNSDAKLTLQCQKTINFNTYSVNVQQIEEKCKTRNNQIRKQVYKTLLDKILKQNQKLQKQIQNVITNLQRQPKDITQMISLQIYASQTAADELVKINQKILQISQKISIVQKTNQQFDFKDFETCYRIYLKPIKIRSTISQRIKIIQHEYKKNFGQALNKSAADLLAEIKDIEQKFYQCTKIQDLNQMDSSFILYSKLKERIQAAEAQMVKINSYETAMKWMTTNFNRLTQIKEEFMPYYRLISLQKNFKFHIETQLSQSLHSIDPAKLTQEVNLGSDQLNQLQFNTFKNNPKILQIVKKVNESYTAFKSKLPLIQILRNADLRQRHWTSIKELTKYYDILSQKITLNELLSRGIKKYQKNLIQISQIATRQLIYQKKLNKMKKQWKDVRVNIQKSFEQNHEDVRVITNLDQVQIKVQKDIYHVQQILSSSFIKFLEKDILNWKNLYLYKIYQFVQIWRKLQKDIVQILYMFSRPQLKIDAKNQYDKFKLIQKNWKGVVVQIQQQPNIIELLQTKILQSIRYLIELIEEIQKVINNFFQKKKQRFSRFGSLSQEQLLKLFANSQKQEEEQTFDMSVKKCLHGVKNIGRNKSNQITSVLTHLDESIQFQQAIQSYGEGQKVMPDKLIEQIQKKIKKSLRSSIDLIDKAAQNKILQIVLLHQRLIFTRQIQTQILNGGVTQGYVDTLDNLKNQIVQVIIQDGKNFKTQAQLTQLINNCRIAQLIYRNDVTQIFDFHWISQIRTYQKNQNYLVELGLNQAQYGFEIIDYEEYIMECNTQKMFLNIGVSMSQRMFSCLRSDYGRGKLSSIHYLASINGRNENILNGHKAISYENIIDYFRMAATGIWIVFNNLNFFSQQTFSTFYQDSQIFWFNYRNSKGKSSFYIGNRFISLSSNDLGLFSTIVTTNNTGHQKICDKISQYYRICSIGKIDLKYIFECKLLLQGFIKADFRRLTSMIELVKAQLQFYCQNYRKTKKINLQNSLSVFSELHFAGKIVKTAKDLRSKMKNIQEDLIIQAAIEEQINQLISENDQLSEEIFLKLKKYYKFVSIQMLNQMRHQQNSQLQDEELYGAYKQFFLRKKLYFNKQIIRSYIHIVQTVKNKHSAIVLGSQSTGKSTLIKLISEPDQVDTIKNDQKATKYHLKLKQVYPEAYSLYNLYGDSKHNGVINSLINTEDAHKNEKDLQNQKDQTVQYQYGILFDGNIKEWIQPLVPLIKNSTIYIQPNGKSLILDKPFKMIFECRQIADVSPSILLSTTIIYLKSQLKWQNIFNSFILKKFPERYHKSSFTSYVESFVSFIIEPIFQFFTNSLKNTKSDLIQGQKYSKCFTNLVNIIPSILSLFNSILDHYYHESYVFQNLESKEKSQILNIFIMSLTWTVGLYVPQQSKKTFSRHLKYIIKRVVQVNIKSVQKQTLPRQQDDIYQICYINSKWKFWSQLQNQAQFTSSIEKLNKLSIQLVKQNNKYFYLMQRYTQNQSPFFLIGGQSSNKNTMMKMFLNKNSSLNGVNQVYNKILMACTPNSSQSDAKRLIIKEIQKQKYSQAFQGFVHGKDTFFYICDLNLPLAKNNNNSLQEFIHEYIMTKGWYLEDDSQKFYFKNIIVCGTLNSNYSFSTHLFKHLNPIPFSQTQKQFKSSLLTVLSQQINLVPYQQNLARLMFNLQDVIKREYSNQFSLAFQKKDLCDIAKGLCKLNRQGYRNQNREDFDQKEKKNILMRKWIYETEKKYMQKFGPNYNWQKMFYFINNVLMEEERLRYKTLFKQNHAIITNFSYYLSKHNNSHKYSVSHPNSLKVLSQKESQTNNYSNNSKNYQIMQQTQTLSKMIKQTIQQDMKLNNTYSQNEDKNQLLKSKEMLYSQIDESSIKFMVDLLDKIQNKGEVIFCLENVKTSITQNSGIQGFSSTSLNRQSSKHSKFKFEPLITMCCSITQKHIIHYEPNQLSDTYIQWKFFITQIFELIWSSQSYEKQYVIVLQNLSQRQQHILQDLLQLKRLQTFSLLQQFIKNQQLQNEELMQNNSSALNKKPSNANSQKIKDSNSSQAQIGNQGQKLTSQKNKDKVLQTEDNANINQKLKIQKAILSRINFILILSQPENQQKFIIENYSMLIQKSSVFWHENYASYVHGLQPQKNKTSYSKKSLKSIKSLKKLNSTTKIQDASQQAQNKYFEEKNSQQEELDERLKSRLEKVQGLLYEPLTLNQLMRMYTFFKSLKNSQNQQENVAITQRNINQQKNIEAKLQEEEEYSYEFLQFVQLFHSFMKIIKEKITKRSLRIRQNLSNLQHLKANGPLINQQIKKSKLLLEQSQNSLSDLNSQLQKYTMQYERYQNTHRKIKQSLEIINKEMGELNQMYNKSVYAQKKQFLQVKTELVQLLKNGKEKKILSTNEIKVCLQILGAIIGKKLKQQESMNRQVAKDINNLKVHKKVSAIDFQINQKSNLSQKTLQKIHQLLSSNHIKAIQSKINQKESYNQKLVYSIKNFAIVLLKFYETNQKEQITQFRKNISKLQKETDHLRLEEQKNFKSKNYQNFLSKYQKTNIQQKQLIKTCQKLKLELIQLAQNAALSEKINNLQTIILKSSDKQEFDQIQMLQKIQSEYQKQLNQLLKIHEAHPIISSILTLQMYFQLKQDFLSQFWHLEFFEKKEIQEFKNISLKEWLRLNVMDLIVSSQNSTNTTQERIGNNINFFSPVNNLQMLSGFVFIQESNKNQKFLTELLTNINYSLDFDTLVNYLQIIKTNHQESMKQNQSSLKMLQQKSQQKLKLQNNEKIQTQKQIQKSTIKDIVIQNSEIEIPKISSNEVVISKKILTSTQKLLQKRTSKSKSNKLLQNYLCCIKISSVQQIQVILNLIEMTQLQINISPLQFSQNSKFIIVVDKYSKEKVKNSSYSCFLIQEDQENSNSFQHMQKIIQEDLTIQKRQIQEKQLAQRLELQEHLQKKQKQIQNLVFSYKSFKTKQNYYLESTFNSYLKQFFNQLSQLSEMKQEQSQFPLVSNKKKGNSASQKITKFCVKVFVGICLLQKKRFIQTFMSYQKYILTIRQIIQKEKENQKKINIAKFGKIFKCALWDHLVSFNIQYKKYFSMIFATAWNADSMRQCQYESFLQSLFEFEKYSLAYLDIQSKLTSKKKENQNALIQSVEANILSSLMPLQKAEGKNINQSDVKRLKKEVKISQEFKNILLRLEQQIKNFKKIYQYINKNKSLWFNYFSTISQNSSCLPQPFQDQNRLYIGLFIALFKPNHLYRWIRLNDEDGVFSNVQDKQALQFVNFTIQKQLLKAVKLQYKCVNLIGSNNLAKIYDLAIIAKKTLKIISKFETDKKAKSGMQSLMNSQNVTRKDINIGNCGLTGAKFQQNLIQQIHNTMKSSGWLFINLENLPSSIQNQSKFDYITKIINKSTKSGLQIAENQQQKGSINNSINSFSSTNFKSTANMNNALNMNMYESNQYLIIISSQKEDDIVKVSDTLQKNSNKKRILSVAQQRSLNSCIIRNNATTFISQSSFVAYNWHQGIKITKKGIKDYEMLSSNLKCLILQICQHLQYSVDTVKKIKKQNNSQNILHQKIISQIINKAFRIFNVLINLKSDRQFIQNQQSSQNKTNSIIFTTQNIKKKTTASPSIFYQNQLHKKQSNSSSNKQKSYDISIQQKKSDLADQKTIKQNHLLNLVYHYIQSSISFQQHLFGFQKLWKLFLTQNKHEKYMKLLQANLNVPTLDTISEYLKENCLNSYSIADNSGDIVFEPTPIMNAKQQKICAISKIRACIKKVNSLHSSFNHSQLQSQSQLSSQQLFPLITTITQIKNKLQEQIYKYEQEHSTYDHFIVKDQTSNKISSNSASKSSDELTINDLKVRYIQKFNQGMDQKQKKNKQKIIYEPLYKLMRSHYFYKIQLSKSIQKNFRIATLVKSLCKFADCKDKDILSKYQELYELIGDVQKFEEQEIFKCILKVQDQLEHNAKIYQQIRHLDRLMIDKCIFSNSQNLPEYSLKYIRELNQFLNIAKQIVVDQQKIPYENVRLIFAFNDKKIRNSSKSLIVLCQFNDFYLYNIKKNQSFLHANHPVFDLDPEIGYGKVLDQGLKLKLYAQIVSQVHEIQNDQQEETQQEILISKKIIKVPLISKKEIKEGVIQRNMSGSNENNFVYVELQKFQYKQCGLHPVFISY